MTPSSYQKWKTVKPSSLRISSKNSLAANSGPSSATDSILSTLPTSTPTSTSRRTCLRSSSSKTARWSAASRRAHSTQASLPTSEKASSSVWLTRRCTKCVPSLGFQSTIFTISTTSSSEMQRSGWSRNRRRCSATSASPTPPSITQAAPSPNSWRWIKRPSKWPTARLRSRLTNFTSWSRMIDYDDALFTLCLNIFSSLSQV